ncbi:3'-5' exonuclease [Actinoplanes sp. ATCC 53533]|uniref:3'-5' exonuclease n=1 Tax=Actinoplanes sp. ATCC 53533 TaxID=1288362 RepID=UPI000F7B96C0|nr:3'-5' exonuclease [Actinoplanes sp. ATCC 53533]RSM73117.1 3'-5' exonuclease [Actinoplanes sp. ATCC 53533]
MELVAIDLEGSGAQERDHEAILEIALVPLIGWQPDMTAAYCTLINPQRPIPRRPWISPGLTDDALRTAPTIEAVSPEIVRRIRGKYLVGHNIGVDWRLLRRRCPTVAPAGLIDTLRLARQTDRAGSNGLAALVERHGLIQDVNRLAPGSAPHRALWDTVACGLLMRALAVHLMGDHASAHALLGVAEVRLDAPAGDVLTQPTLFDQSR